MLHRSEPTLPRDPIAPVPSDARRRGEAESLHLQKGGLGTDASLQDRVLKAQRMAARWRDRAWAPHPSRWLVDVPDVGPACEVILADKLFHDLDASERDGLMAWIRGCQDESGAWLDATGRPSLSLTTLGWWACATAGDDPASEPMMRATRVVHALGGAQRTSFDVRLWLAMGGQIPWQWLPAIPAEMFLLPPSVPLSPANYSPWARGMLTPYLLIARAPARLQLPAATPLLLQRTAGQTVAPRLTRAGLAGDVLQAFDRAVKLSRKLPRGPLPRLAARRALDLLDACQQEHGGWFSLRPTLLSLVALRVMGASSDDPRIRRGLDHLRACRGLARIPHGRDAGAVVLAQGVTTGPLRTGARLLRAAPRESDMAWLIRQEITDAGPWQRRADAPAGGWPLEAGARHHLDLEATCAVLDALGAVDPSSSQLAPAWATARRGMDVLLAMQEPDGHFSRFERGESDVFMQRFPWTDADLLAQGDGQDDDHVRLTAQALAQLAATGFRLDDDRVALGMRWLEKRVTLATGRGDVVGMPMPTLAALARCTGALCPADHPLRQRIDEQLRRRQREAGDFGSVHDTALALQGLLALGRPCVQMRRAARFLADVIDRRTEDDPVFVARATTGFGLCSHTFDPSAGVRETALALDAFARAGGTLEA
jgi:squalene-hopene/tetraprenyl-beta-curcumene cyclase